jgi:hypothetical protein
MDGSGLGLNVATAFPIRSSNKCIFNILHTDLLLQDLLQKLRAKITLEEFWST